MVETTNWEDRPPGQTRDLHRRQHPRRRGDGREVILSHQEALRGYRTTPHHQLLDEVFYFIRRIAVDGSSTTSRPVYAPVNIQLGGR